MFKVGDRVTVVLAPEEDSLGGDTGTVTRTDVPGLPGIVYVQLDQDGEEPFNIGEIR